MASATLSRRVRKVVAYPPLRDMSDLQRRNFHEALLEAERFEDLARKVAGGNPEGRTEPAEPADRRQRLAGRLDWVENAEAHHAWAWASE